MPCGCQNTCGCNLIAGAGIAVAVLPGGTFQISNTNPDAVGGVPVFVQQAAPAATGAYVWYELDNLGNVVTVWIENGLP